MEGPKINYIKVEDEIVQDVIVCYDVSSLSRLEQEK